jgi:5-methylcytosine-specific restriction endonuclease McrA
MAMKVCTMCDKEKDEVDFYRNKVRGELYSYCKECDKSRHNKEKRKARDKRNEEKLREYRHQYNCQPNVREKICQHAKTEEEKERKRKWRQTPQGKQYMSASHKRWHARRMGVVSNFTHKDWIELVGDYGSRCVYCNKKLENPEQDHIVPLSQGGEHAKENVVPSCRSCNASKNNKTLVVWMARQRLMCGGVS